MNQRNLLWNGRTLAETTREAAEKKEALEAARSRKAEAAIQLADLVIQGGGGRSAIENAEEAYGDADDAYADALEAEEAAGDVAHEHAKMVADLMRQKQHRLARLQNEHRPGLPRGPGSRRDEVQRPALVRRVVAFPGPHSEGCA